MWGDSNGAIFITNRNDCEKCQPSKIRKIGTSGIITTIVGGGTNSFGQGTNAFLNNPSALTGDSAGNFYFAEGGTIRKMSIKSGILSTYITTTGNLLFFIIECLLLDFCYNLFCL